MRLVPLVAVLVDGPWWSAIVAFVVKLHLFEVGHRLFTERATRAKRTSLQAVSIPVLLQLCVDHQLVGFSDKEIEGSPVIRNGGEGVSKQLIRNLLRDLWSHSFDDLKDGCAQSCSALLRNLDHGLVYMGCCYICQNPSHERATGSID